MMIFNQNPTDSITQTVTKAIDAGNIGVMVLLTVGLIVLGVIMGVLILRVLVPLLRQVIELTAQVTTMINRTNDAIEHSNETNKLVAGATTEQTGAIQRVDKNISDMSGKIEILSLNFGSYQTLQTDTTAGLVDRFDSFDTQLEAIKRLIETNTGDQTELKNAFMKVADEIKAMHDDVRKLFPPPPPTNVVNVNTAPADKPDDGLLKTG